jgi:hypothetical protein
LVFSTSKAKRPAAQDLLLLVAAVPNSLHVSFQRSDPSALIRACVAVNLEIVVLTFATW